MTYDNITSTLSASEGKVLRRKADGMVYGESIMLGKTWYIGGKRLDTPHDDVPEDFEETEIPHESIADEPALTDEMKAQELEYAKREKIREIEDYDESDAVNSFVIGGVRMWLSFDERTRIRSSIGAYRNEGKKTMTKWFGGKEFTFDLDTWQGMLDKLSVYASEALNVTEGHKAEVEAMTDIDLVRGFDVEAGYPERLRF